MELDIQKIKKMSPSMKNECNRRIEMIKTCLPANFQRRPRPLSEIDYYKATELRLFLLYIGKIVLLT